MTMFQESMCQSQRNSFDQFNNYCAIDVKMDGKAVLEEKPSLTILGLFLFYIGLGSYIILAAKTTPTTIGALIRYLKFLSLMVSLLFLSICHEDLHRILVSNLRWCC